MPACIMEGLKDIGLNYANFYTASSVGDYNTAEPISDDGQQAVANSMVEWCEQTGLRFSPRFIGRKSRRALSSSTARIPTATLW